MKAKRELGSQLNLLLTGMAVNGIAHLEEMENDLNQTNILLEEAINKLNNSFLALHEAMKEHMEITAHLVVDTRSAEMQCEQISKLADDVASRIDSIVTGLQFQDMTNQLLGRALNRIDGLRLMLGAFASVGPALMQQNAKEDMIGILESTNKRLALQSKELNGQLERAVKQQHMEGGSIELFLKE